MGEGRRDQHGQARKARVNFFRKTMHFPFRPASPEPLVKRARSGSSSEKGLIGKGRRIGQKGIHTTPFFARLHDPLASG